MVKCTFYFHLIHLFGLLSVFCPSPKPVQWVDPFKHSLVNILFNRFSVGCLKVHWHEIFGLKWFGLMNITKLLINHLKYFRVCRRIHIRWSGQFHSANVRKCAQFHSAYSARGPKSVWDRFFFNNCCSRWSVITSNKSRNARNMTRDEQGMHNYFALALQKIFLVYSDKYVEWA